MIEAALVAALVVVVLTAIYVLDTAQARANAMLNEAHQRFDTERAQWLQERQVLLNRIMDPPAGVAQSLAIGLPAFDPSADSAEEFPVDEQEMPDFPVYGQYGEPTDRTLT